MTWQRINEDTYIDDTLVTCAEYQLFIDEMREQGKYYQPDHWTSYQFPRGQAREPILGVRYTDAGAFCEWLTKQDASELRYRLPAKSEALDYSIKIFQTQLLLGNWAMGNHNRPQFVWAGTVPANARHLDLKSTPSLRRIQIIDRELSLNQAFNFDRLNIEAVDLGGIYDLNADFETIHSFVADHSLAANLERIQEMDLALSKATHSVDYVHDHELLASIYNALDLDRKLDLALAIYRNIQHSYSAHEILSKELDRVHEAEFRQLQRKYARCQSQALDLARGLSQAQRTLDRAFAKANDFINLLDTALKNALQLLADIITMQERIAGRSPAFEGIRLVKERIR